MTPHHLSPAPLRGPQLAHVEGLSQPTWLTSSHFNVLQQAALVTPRASALSFFRQVDGYYTPETWTYRQWLGAIYQCANLLQHLNVTPTTVIATLLPNIPEMHWLHWGGRLQGIVASLDIHQDTTRLLTDLHSLQPSLLVIPAPFPHSPYWPKLADILLNLRHLKHVILVNPADRYLGWSGIQAQVQQVQEEQRLYGIKGIKGFLSPNCKVYNYKKASERQYSRRLLQQHLPKQNAIASISPVYDRGDYTLTTYSHQQEYQLLQYLGRQRTDWRPKRHLSAQRLCQVTHALEAGLLPFSCGEHVILATAEGFDNHQLPQKLDEIIHYFGIDYPQNHIQPIMARSIPSLFSEHILPI